MKKIKYYMLPFLITLGFLWMGSFQKAQAQPGARVSFQLFYDELAPYGDWVRDREYGYIWLPNVGRDFHPYSSNGYWVRTQYGNTWVSDYDWGWAPFHYGRWIYDDYYGWAWIPGYEWGPAWVEWRSGNGYFGWAPLSPRVNVHISIGSPLWVFVPQKHIFHKRLHRYRAPSRHYTQIYNKTVIINNVYVNNNVRYNAGPRVSDLERATRSKVRVHEVRHTQKPGRTSIRGNTVALYRPEVDRGSQAQARPSRTQDAQRVVAQRSSNSRSGSQNSRVLVGSSQESSTRGSSSREVISRDNSSRQAPARGSESRQVISRENSSRQAPSRGSESRSVERKTQSSSSPSRVTPSRSESSGRSQSRESVRSASPSRSTAPTQRSVQSSRSTSENSRSTRN